MSARRRISDLCMAYKLHHTPSIARWRNLWLMVTADVLDSPRNAAAYSNSTLVKLQARVERNYLLESCYFYLLVSYVQAQKEVTHH